MVRFRYFQARRALVTPSLHYDSRLERPQVVAFPHCAARNHFIIRSPSSGRTKGSGEGLSRNQYATEV